MSPHWSAKWISYAYDPRQDLGVFAFRNRLNVTTAPNQLLVRVSADNRYKLYVNGHMVSFGPQRGDQRHWFYETVDLAPWLQEGENWIAALVWNFGWMAPMAQHTVRTGFVLDVLDETEIPRLGEGSWTPSTVTPDKGPESGLSSELEALRTPGKWEVARLDGWSFDMMHSGVGEFYIDIGPGEIYDAGRIPSDWEIGRPGGEWRSPHVISGAEVRGANGGGTPWMLTLRSLPSMRYRSRIEPPRVRRGFVGDSGGPGDGEPLSAAMNLEAGQKLLLDYTELLCAFPRLKASGAVGATVTLTYAESMWNPDGSKGNRNEVAGKEMRGYQDKVILGPGGASFEPAWWRTYRYLQIESDGPVTVESIDAIETGYPLEVESSFSADHPAVDPIWDVSVRTAERCAGETYFDCPYYEQLQYVGDTRIQALIGYYLGRDRTLQRNAVETLGWSLMENGLTQSRYPSRQTQVIPPFSLWWVLMRHDQRFYDRWNEPDPNDDDPIDNEGLDVANAFNALSGEPIDRTFWNFGDWVPDWRWGVPPGSARSTLHMLTLYLAHMATEIVLERGGPEAEQRRKTLAGYIFNQLERRDGLVRHGRDLDWKPSEHAEALFRILQGRLGIVPDPWPAEALERVGAARCTYYFQYYKHLAMRPADYMAELAPWREMIESGLSTFAENPEPVRSDCHAWSAHPILGFFQIVAGVTSAGPGWRKARIEPQPGSLRRFDARIAHLDGELRVAYENDHLTIETPVEAELVWQGKRAILVPGKHEV
jgi:alpha-L-rhamnosidase